MYGPLVRQVVELTEQQGRLAEQVAVGPAAAWQQTPPSQRSAPCVKQLLPQAPQLDGVLFVSVQVPLQQRPAVVGQGVLSGAGMQVLPGPQVWQSPQVQFSVPPQPSGTVPQVPQDMT